MDFDRILVTDLGELDHVICLFGEYRHTPDNCRIEAVERGGPWAHLVSWFRAYLNECGVPNARELTASDLTYELRNQFRTDICAAMRCLLLLLSHYSTHDWDDDAVEDLRHRLTAFCAIWLEDHSNRLAETAKRGELFVHGRPKGARGPLGRILTGICNDIGTFDLDAVLSELHRRASAGDIVVDEYDDVGKRVWFVLKGGHPAQSRAFKTIANSLSRLAKGPSLPEKR